MYLRYTIDALRYYEANCESQPETHQANYSYSIVSAGIRLTQHSCTRESRVSNSLVFQIFSRKRYTSHLLIFLNPRGRNRHHFNDTPSHSCCTFSVHQNYVGIDCDKVPFFLSVVVTDANNQCVPQYRVILWRNTGSQKILLPYGSNKPLTVKQILRYFAISFLQYFLTYQE